MRLNFHRARSQHQNLKGSSTGIENGPSNPPVPASNEPLSNLPFIAYRTKDGGPQIGSAEPNRRWMNKTPMGFANRCLPLRIANQAGWFILNHELVEVVWDGGNDVNSLTVTRGTLDNRFLSSHFGQGILTWKIPYLFKTPSGFNLYIRGPANWCKDGAVPLDGIVETDWVAATFTMNWKVTRPRVPIRFEKGDPICMVFPIARGDIERFVPEIRSISENQDLRDQYNEWSNSRREFNSKIRDSGPTGDWQKHYYLGKTLRGKIFAAHQVHLKIRKFRDLE